MVNTPANLIVGISREDVEERLARIAARDARIREHQAAILAEETAKQADVQWLEAVKLLGGVDVVTAALSAQLDNNFTETTSVVDALKVVLRQQTAGRTPKELAEILKRTAVGHKVVKTPNAFYAAIKRLCDRGFAEQRGKLYYDATVLARIDAGELSDPRADDPEAAGRSLRDVVMDLMERSATRLTAKEVRDALAHDPHYGEKVVARPNYSYNVLNRLADAGKLEKVDNAYGLRNRDYKPANVTLFPGAGSHG